MDWLIILMTVWEYVKDFYLEVIIPYNQTIPYSVKLTISLFFLIFIRAGLPRYRYDYITKLGWSKFLLFVTSTLIIIYLMSGLWS